MTGIPLVRLSVSDPDHPLLQLACAPIVSTSTRCGATKIGRQVDAIGVLGEDKDGD